MKVVPFMHSVFTFQGESLMDKLGFYFEWDDRELDIAAEFAGRACYESYDKPNPATATNDKYLAHILETGHESVLEHSTVTFYVSGVSRNLLLELERHRHLSFSVISTRYVDPDKMGLAIHPNTPTQLVDAIKDHDLKGRELAKKIFETARNAGYGKKAAREIARQVLGGNTETKFLVTGNLRAWRYVIRLRDHDKADAEIREFAREVLYHLSQLAPNSVQDLVHE